MNYSKGICWIDDCRIPFVDDTDLNNTINAKYSIDKNTDQSKDWGTKKIGNVSKPEGRFPANLLVSDDMLNDGSMGKGQKNPRIQKGNSRYGENNFTNGGLYVPDGHISPTYNDKGSNSRYYDIDIWFNNLINNI